MNDDSKTRRLEESGEWPPEAEDLSGLTEAIGGLDPAEPGQDPLLGRNIGGVTIIEPIAEGGMGRVYKGLQEKPSRPVAVKVMRPGFVSRDACRRFDNESEVLGRLRHPYIAQIYSAGICTIVGAQVPYFVMEFIPDALPVTKYATAKKLSTHDRIELFRKVCEAVAHGHEKNVVHRDLKPSNILVEPNGVPKIIDFGIARCVDVSPEAMTALTDMGQLIGTLQYMSPEQFSGDPSAIDARADVYALGVILYELLAGRPPYEIREKQIFDAARVVREQKPPSPVKFNRNLTSEAVRITGTCLQKDQRRRYSNAAELTQALGDYLAGRPVPARTQSRFSLAIDKAVTWIKARPARTAAWISLPFLALVSLSWLPWPAPTNQDVAKDSSVSFRFNGHAYRIFLDAMTRDEAVRKCTERGGYLARITTAAENKAVFAAALTAAIGSSRLWIDGSRTHGAADGWQFQNKKKMSFFYRGLDRLNESGEAFGAVAVVVDRPVAYWEPLDESSRADGYVCEWDN